MKKKQVSIVILAHDALDYTKQCIDKLLEEENDHEIIVVDNASVDGTATYLRHLGMMYGDFTVVSSDVNHGFAAGCNAGVSAATRPYICLLNNDIIPVDGWLDNMLKVFDKEENVGIVGSKLVYPDNINSLSGTIQHCWIEFYLHDKPKKYYQPYHVHHGESPDLPEVNERKKVPAVTAACMLTTREIWDKVGGLDAEAYKVANYEDIDFNLKVRELGYNIYYEPTSKLFHYGGVTLKQYKDVEQKEKNLEVFTKLWQKKLEAGLATV